MMTENRAISKAETTGMTLEDVISKITGHTGLAEHCPTDNISCNKEINCDKCFADYIRKNRERLK